MSGLHQQITFATGAPAVHVATTALCRLYSRASDPSPPNRSFPGGREPAARD